MTETDISFPDRVVRVLSVVFDGLHHIDREWARAEITPHYVRVVIHDGHSFATYDFDLLTRLVVAAHDLCVRVEVQAATHGYLRLHFSPRERVADNTYTRHPTLEDAVEGIRNGRMARICLRSMGEAQP